METVAIIVSGASVLAVGILGYLYAKALAAKTREENRADEAVATRVAAVSHSQELQRLLNERTKELMYVKRKYYKNLDADGLVAHFNERMHKVSGPEDS